MLFMTLKHGRVLVPGVGSRVFKQTHFLCYILYIDQWGFHFIEFQNIVKSVLDLDVLGRHVCCSSVDNSTTSSTH